MTLHHWMSPGHELMSHRKKNKSVAVCLVSWLQNFIFWFVLICNYCQVLVWKLLPTLYTVFPLCLRTESHFCPPTACKWKTFCCVFQSEVILLFGSNVVRAHWTWNPARVALTLRAVELLMKWKRWILQREREQRGTKWKKRDRFSCIKYAQGFSLPLVIHKLAVGVKCGCFLFHLLLFFSA